MKKLLPQGFNEGSAKKHWKRAVIVNHPNPALELEGLEGCPRKNAIDNSMGATVVIGPCNVKSYRECPGGNKVHVEIVKKLKTVMPAIGACPVGACPVGACSTTDWPLSIYFNLIIKSIK